MNERTAELDKTVTALRSSEAHYRAIVDAFDGLIYICSQDYRIEFMNNKLIERTGYAAVGELCFKVMHDRDSVCPWCVNDRIFAGETVRWEMLSPKDNRWYYVVNVPVYKANGSISKYSMIMDITDRKRAEESLKRAKEEWERTFASVPDLVGILDNRHRVLRVNEAMAKRLGLKPDECVGLPCYEAIHGLSEPPEFCPHTRTLRDGRKHVEEVYEERLGGDFLVSTIPLNDEREVMIGSVHIAYDITERKLAEGRLKQKKQLLEELNSTLEKRVYEEVEKNREKDIILIQQNRTAALGEMFDHIAHQWKQPLNSIAVIIQALGATSAHEQVTASDILETVDNIMDIVAHMAQTVEVFRNFYKPDKKKSVFLVKDAIDKALTFVMPVFRRYGIEVDLDADAQLLAFGYPKEYAQVLLNILANAKDAFMERRAENPRINIRAFADGDNTVVTIKDNAGGIPGESIEKIFDLYFTTKESNGGTGIGLYMSKNIIEKNMGGELTVSNVNDGAQFRIELGKI